MVPIIYLLFAVLFQLSHSLTAITAGREIRDVYSVLGTCFTNEANTWNANLKWTPTTPIYTANCGGYGLVGGYGVLGGGTSTQGNYFYKTYSNLPTHTRIYYTMTLYALDSWSFGAVGGGDDHFDLKFDTRNVEGFRLSVFNFYEPLCGGTWNDLRNIRVFGVMAHSADSLTLNVIHMLDQDSGDESVGFREVSLIFVESTVAPTMCGQAPFSFTGQCTCPEGEYWNSYACTSCHANCESCFGPSESECFQCRPGTYFNGVMCTPCSAGCAICHGTGDDQCDACMTGYSLFNGKSCIYPCNAPLVKGTTTGGCVETCSSPCSLTDFIYWDGSCSATCDAPLRPGYLTKYFKTCNFPCPNGQFLYWDGSCSDTCLSPRTRRTDKGQRYCGFPCAAGEYASWDGSCKSACLPPLVASSSNGKLFCKYPCAPTEYLYWNGSCIGTCTFPLSERIADGDNYCDYPCRVNEFLYWDGNCAADCLPPLSSRLEGSPRVRNYCDYGAAPTQILYPDGTYHTSCNPPLISKTVRGYPYCEILCDPLKYTYWNGSCLDDCLPPLQWENVDGVLFCKFPCTTQTDYLYWDNTCSADCPFPLTQSTIGGNVSRKLCHYKCLSTETLFWNGTCAPSCPPYFTQDTQHLRNFCKYPCDYTEFLYYNGSCKPNCPYPLITKKLNGYGYCQYPCQSSQYLFWNGSCIDSCPEPLKATDGPSGEFYCSFPCDNPLEYYHSDTRTCTATCDRPSRFEGNLFLMCLAYNAPTGAQGFLDLLLTADAGPGAPTLLITNRYTQYLSVLNMQRTDRLERLARSRARNVIALKVKATVPNGLLTALSATRLLSSSNSMPSTNFILNYFGDIIFMVISIILAGLFQLLEKVFKDSKSTGAGAFCEKFRKIFMWNLCFMLVAANCDDIILLSGLDIKTLSMDIPLATISILTGVIFIVLIVVVLATTLYVVFRFREFRKETISTKKNDDCFEFSQKWERFYVLFGGFKEDSRLKQLFYLIYIIRIIIPQIIAVAAVDSPLVPMIFQLLVNIFMLAYLLLLKPLKKQINRVQMLIIEGISLCATIAALILVSTPYNNDGTVSSTHTRTFVGDLIILSSLCINLVNVVFLVVKMCIGIKLRYNYINKYPDADKTVWIELLAIIAQQGAFGFEEMIDDSYLTTGRIYEKARLQPNDITSKTLNKDDESASHPTELQIEEKKRKPNLIPSLMSPEQLNDSPNTSSLMTSPGLAASPTSKVGLLKKGSNFDFESGSRSPDIKERLEQKRLERLKMIADKKKMESNG